MLKSESVKVTVNVSRWCTMLSHFGAFEIQFGPIDSSAQLTVSATNVMLLTCHLMSRVLFHGPTVDESRDAVTGRKNL